MLTIYLIRLSKVFCESLTNENLNTRTIIIKDTYSAPEEDQRIDGLKCCENSIIQRMSLIVPISFAMIMILFRILPYCAYLRKA